jgi:serine/threonine-protein kinase
MSDSQLPERFGRYEVESQIGDGSMGRVYRALDPVVGRHVAVKTIKKEYLSEDSSAEYVRRFQREARASGALSHPGIVDIFDVGPDYIVMELLEGQTLAQLVAERGQLELSEALWVLRAMAEAIDFAHERGVIHRDLKPANVMVLEGGGVKLMDFGVARVESSVMTRAGEVLGSPSYMAPEQIAGSDVSRRSDLYSLGVVAYEILTGRRPFTGNTVTTVIYKVMHEAAPAPRTWRSDLPEVYDRVFERALAKDPADRFESAEQLVAALAGELELPEPDVELEVVEEPPAPAGDAQASVPSLALWVALAVLLGVGLLGLLWRRGAAGPPVLAIETTPAGARVQVDGAGVGTSPLRIEIPPGSHDVRLSLDGYAPAAMSIDVREGEEPAPLRFELSPVVASLEVVSSPGQADVFVDGRKMGQTPLAALQVPAGSHDLLVNRVGYRSWRRSLEATAGETLRFDAALEPMGDVAANGAAVPAAAEVAADITPPRRKSGDPAPYPREARESALEGSVTVELTVTQEGIPKDLEVVESAGEVLDRAVLAAVSQWRFEPATRDGAPVEVRWRTRQRFQLR